MFPDTGPNDAASEMSHDLEFIGALLDARYPMSDGERIDLNDGLSAAPLFVLGRTRLGCVWRFRTDVPVELVRGVAKLAGREPKVYRAPSPSLLSVGISPIQECEQCCRLLISRLLSSHHFSCATMGTLCIQCKSV